MQTWLWIISTLVWGVITFFVGVACYLKGRQVGLELMRDEALKAIRTAQSQMAMLTKISAKSD